jgi:hypothetical protein
MFIGRVMHNLYSIFEFKFPIGVSKSALGKIYPIKIAGVSGFIHTPHSPLWTENESEPLRRLLTAPEVAIRWKQGCEPIFWGKPNSYPEGDSCLHKVIFEFNVDDFEFKGKLIYESFISWLNLLLDYIEIMTNQNVRIEQTLNVYGDQFSLFHLSKEGKRKRISENIEIIINLEGWQRNISDVVLSKSCNLASSCLQPKLPYRLYLEANRAFLQKDYRKTLIECGTAIENALTESIIAELIRIGKTEDEIGILLNRKCNKTLGGRFNLADSQLKLDLLQQQYDYRKLLIEPRNEVVHEAKFITRSVARLAIEYTNKLLCEISPEIQET